MTQEGKVISGLDAGTAARTDVIPKQDQAGLLPAEYISLDQVLGLIQIGDLPDLSSQYTTVASLASYLDKATYDTNNDGILDASAIPATPESNIFYVGKHGDNADPGTSLATAFLTFAAALAAAAAGDTIVCLDAGTYTEGIAAKDGVNIYAPNATLNVTGSQIVMAEMTLTANKITRASGFNAMIQFDGVPSTRQKLVANIVDDYGSNIAIRFTYNSIPILDIKELYVSGGGVGIAGYNVAVHGHYRIADLYLNSDGAIGLQSNVAGCLHIGTVQHIVDLGYANTVAIDCNAGAIDLIAQEISADTAIDIASGATLNLIATRVIGTVNNAGTYNRFVADEAITDDKLPSGIVTPDTYHNATITTDTYGRVVAAAAGVLSGRNSVINGTGAICQRQSDPATATAYNDADYCTFDRWKVLSSSGTNTTQTRRIDGDQQRYAMRLIQTSSTARRIGLVQFIEGADCKHFEGQQITLSARLRCSASADVSIGVLAWAGTEDQPTNDPVASWAITPTWAASYSLAGSSTASLTANTWQDASATMTLPSSISNLAIIAWSADTLAQNVTLDIEGAQHERGSVATPFEARPYGEELLLCQRYYQVFSPGNAFYVGYLWAGSNYIYNQVVTLPVLMRITPSVTDTNPSWSASFPGINNEASFYGPVAGAYATSPGIFTINYTTSVSSLSFRFADSVDFGGGLSIGDIGRATFGTAYRAYLDAEL